MLTVVLFLVVALSAAASTRQAKQSRSKVTPKRAATAIKRDAKVVAASSESVAAPLQPSGPRLVVQLGQRTSLYGFATFSRDGHLVATGGGGDVVVWDVATRARGATARRKRGRPRRAGLGRTDGRRVLGLAVLADKTQRPSLFDYARRRRRASVLSRK